MIGTLLLTLPAAASAPLPEAAHLFAAVVPAFEAEARVSFSEIPPLIVSNVEEMVLTYVSERYREGAPRESLFSLAQAYQEELEQFPAYYDLETKEIYVLEDVVAELREDAELGPVEGWLPCVLAHELTHAMQHQLGWVTTRSANRWIFEGHANHLGARVCAAMGLEEGLALMQQMHRPVPALAPRTLAAVPEEVRDLALGYGYSWILFDMVYAREGDAGVEAMLLDPPSRVEVVARVVAPYPQTHWEPADLLAACTLLGRGADEVSEASAQVQGLGPFADVIRTGRGCEARHRRQNRSSVRAILLTDADAAASVMAAYRASPSIGGFFYFAGEVSVPGADEAFILERSASAAVFARIGERIVIAEQHGGRLTGKLATAMLTEWLPSLPEP